MHYEIQLQQDGPLLGFAARSCKQGERASFINREFLSSEDGMLLISRLEEIGRLFLPPRTDGWIPPSQVDRLIVVVDKTSKAQVYINEPDFTIRIQSKREIHAGEPVALNDIADITEFSIENISIPDEAGWFVLFSSGWRKGLVFDLSSLMPGSKPAREDTSKLLAAAYAYVAFQERFSLTDTEWSRLISQGWFPFTALNTPLLNNMLLRSKQGLEVDDLLPDIIHEVKSSLPQFRHFLASSEKFTRHRKILNEAIDAYQAGQVGVATTTIFTRIEGILREHYAALGGKNPGQTTFIPSILSDPQAHRHAQSLLLPRFFEKFLREAVFAGEDFTDPTQVEKITRHSIAHGLAPEKKLDDKAFAISFLTIRQLGFLLTS